MQRLPTVSPRASRCLRQERTTPLLLTGTDSPTLNTRIYAPTRATHTWALTQARPPQSLCLSPRRADFCISTTAQTRVSRLTLSPQSWRRYTTLRLTSSTSRHRLSRATARTLYVRDWVLTTALLKRSHITRLRLISARMLTLSSTSADRTSSASR